MNKVLVTVTGKTDLQTFQGTEFKKIDLLADESNGTPYKFEFHNERVDLLKDIIVGSEVVVYFSIRGNYYDKKDKNGKLTGAKDVSNSLVAYKIKSI